MPLNKSKGNMYGFITHTWNTIKGECPHGCSYCYMKRFGKQKPVRFDDKELKTDLGKGNYIFVGSSCDMFAAGVFDEWIIKTLRHCTKHKENKYFFQSKNPVRMAKFSEFFRELNPVLCTTIETNRFYKDIMANSPPIEERVFGMRMLRKFSQHVTIEPVIDFDTEDIARIIKQINSEKINIGADSCGNNLPEPSADKIKNLCQKHPSSVKIEEKTNLKMVG